MRTIWLSTAMITAVVLNAVSQERQEETLTITTISTDPKYGYTPKSKHAIKVGSVANEYKFVKALAGPDGQPISATRLGSCCSFKSKRATFGTALLDQWEITWSSQTQPVVIYLNPYDFETPMCPKGLTIKQASFTAREPQQVDTATRRSEKNPWLKTGWYVEANQRTLFARVARGKLDTILLDPTPIITTEDFETLTVREKTESQPALLVFKFKEGAVQRWYDTTSRYVGERIAFVLNNELIQALVVAEPLYGGFASISGSSVQELETIKKQIELVNR
jgi:hypothetical protein